MFEKQTSILTLLNVRRDHVLTVTFLRVNSIHPKDIDPFICAEISDQKLEPEL